MFTQISAPGFKGYVWLSLRHSWAQTLQSPCVLLFQKKKEMKLKITLSKKYICLGPQGNVNKYVHIANLYFNNIRMYMILKLSTEYTLAHFYNQV